MPFEYAYGVCPECGEDCLLIDYDERWPEPCPHCYPQYDLQSDDPEDFPPVVDVTCITEQKYGLYLARGVWEV